MNTSEIIPPTPKRSAFRFIEAATKYKAPSSSAKCIAMIAAKYANVDTGVVFASKERMITESRLSRNAGFKAFEALCDDQVLVFTGRRSGSTGNIKEFALSLTRLIELGLTEADYEKLSPKKSKRRQEAFKQKRIESDTVKRTESDTVKRTESDTEITSRIAREIASTYSEAQSYDMRNAHLVTDFIELWRKAADGDCWPVVILSGTDNHAVEFFGPQIQTRLSSELERSTPDQLINEMRTVTIELLDNQEWRNTDDQPKSIAWHFEMLDQYRQNGFFRDSTTTGSSDCTYQTWEADQPQAKAVDQCMVDLEVLKPEPLNETFTQMVEKPTFEGETKRSVSVATKTAPQEEKAPKPAEVDSLIENTLKTAENGLVSARGEMAARQRMLNCRNNKQIPDDIMTKLEQLLVTNAVKAKSRRKRNNTELNQ